MAIPPIDMEKAVETGFGVRRRLDPVLDTVRWRCLLYILVDIQNKMIAMQVWVQMKGQGKIYTFQSHELNGAIYSQD